MLTRMTSNIRIISSLNYILNQIVLNRRLFLCWYFCTIRLKVSLRSFSSKEETFLSCQNERNINLKYIQSRSNISCLFDWKAAQATSWFRNERILVVLKQSPHQDNFGFPPQKLKPFFRNNVLHGMFEAII